MANWNLPTATSDYLGFVTEMNAKFVDAGTLFGVVTATNAPVGAFRFNRGTNIFEEHTGANNWVPKIIGVAGGGTGSTNPAGIIAGLGLGSMSTQNSNAVNITGGSITGVNFSANNITSGILPLARGGTGQSMSLTPYGTVMLSDATRLVLASGAYIAELNASNLTQGIVPAARLSNVGLLSANNNWTGINSFNDSLTINGGYPGFYLINTTGAVNKHRLYFFNYLGDFYIQSQNDDVTFAANLFRVSAEGIIYSIGSGITGLNASNLAYGTVPTARLGAGDANSTTFLRGDSVWAEPPAGGVGGSIPSGLIAIFDTGCPAGWSRFAGLDNRFPRGSTGFGGSGGSSSHRHEVGGNTSTEGEHYHSFSGSGSGSGDGETDQTSSAVTTQIGVDGIASKYTHQHDFEVDVTVDVSGYTSENGDHNHSYSSFTDYQDHHPPYLNVVWCRKD